MERPAVGRVARDFLKKKPPLLVASEMLAVGTVSSEPLSAANSLYQGLLQGI